MVPALKTVIITGGAGFIGSAVIRDLIQNHDYRVINFDKLTYAGNLESLASIADHPNYRFVHGDICDPIAVNKLFLENRPDAIMHLAAESHVDRSIDGPAEFISTNIVGTSVLLEAARSYWNELEDQTAFRFHHVSTDEVFGTLGKADCFTSKVRISQTRRTRPARRPLTTWCEPGTRPMACRW
jgi:dTDP-glucose 4,6-dehydratase